jgi:hypothetical protein
MTQTELRMDDHDGLSNLILVHWQTFSPRLYSQLQQSGRLQEALRETSQQMADLLYDLISVRKLEHHQAWEMATDQFLTTEESP